MIFSFSVLKDIITRKPKEKFWGFVFHFLFFRREKKRGVKLVRGPVAVELETLPFFFKLVERN